MENPINVRLPEWASDYIAEKSEEKTIPKSTLLRMLVVERIREKQEEDGESCV